MRHAARIRYKRFGAALPFKARIKSVFGGKILDGLDEALSRPLGVESNVKERREFSGDHIDGADARLNVGNLEGGRSEIVVTLIPLAGSEFGKKWRRFVNRVFRQMRVGDMSGFAADCDFSV